MIIKSIYDNTIYYDTESKTINGSTIIAEYYTDDVNLYADNDANYQRLKRIGYNRVILTENNKLYGINGARWDGLYEYTINVNKEVVVC